MRRALTALVGLCLISAGSYGGLFGLILLFMDTSGKDQSIYFLYIIGAVIVIMAGFYLIWWAVKPFWKRK